MASNEGSVDGTSGECEEPEDPSSSTLAEAIEKIDLEPKHPQDELTEFRQRWRQELEVNSTPEPESTRTPEPEIKPAIKDKQTSPREDDMATEPQDEQTTFRHNWRRELEATPTPETEVTPVTEAEQTPPESEEEMAKRIFLRAAELERRGEPYEAVPLYRRALQLAPDVEVRLYCAGAQLADQHQVESEPEEVPTENHNQSDDEEEWIEGEDLLTRLQRIVNRRGVLCEPEIPTKEAHLSWLPCEVVALVLRWVVGSELDARSLERVAACCRGLYVLARDRDLYRDLCLSTWGVECGTPRGLGLGSWREMYISRPRLLLHGCYISKTTYLRQGENSFQDQFYRPLFLVHYYRYLRFFPDGTVLMWTTPDEPVGCVPQLKTKLVKAALGIMTGHYRLMGDKVVIVIKKSTDKKQPPSNHTRFRSRRREVPEQHEQIFHVELELRDVRHRRNFQLAWRAYSICSRRDQWTQFDITPAKFPPFAFSGVKSYMAEATAPL
ncbi:F-box only protein 9 [Plodia interpunctella]|uniref:F-box only protein 9 n=1 Tax=Plodia interpunctella TaxID=58824 RepID=UPI002367E707|nr:F-box only protein 9 [Plodia interpunctella]